MDVSRPLDAQRPRIDATRPRGAERTRAAPMVDDQPGVEHAIDRIPSLNVFADILDAVGAQVRCERPPGPKTSCRSRLSRNMASR